MVMTRKEGRKPGSWGARLALAWFVCGLAFAQAPPAPLAFEVASVKASPLPFPSDAQILSGRVHVGMHLDGARVDFGYTPLLDLIAAAWGVKPFQVDGPSWLKSTRFDIVAKLPEGATRNQLPGMMRTLLADRFKMTVHRESKEHAEFALQVATGGVKLKEAAPAAADSPAQPGEIIVDSLDGPMRKAPTSSGTRFQGQGYDLVLWGMNGALHVGATRITMKALAEIVLSRLSPMPVVDKTGLDGSYQFTLDVSREEWAAIAQGSGGIAAVNGEPLPVNEASEPSGPWIAALLSKYGLKLVPQKTAVDIVAIDHIEKTPTEN